MTPPRHDAPLRRLIALAVLATAIGVWSSGCPDPGGGEDGGQDAGHEHDAGEDGGGGGGDAGPDGGGGGSDGGSDSGVSLDPSIATSNQALSISTDVTVATVTALATGWVVVSAPLSDGGAASGFTGVTAGTATGVHVAVADPLSDGTTVTAGLYRDLGVAGTYEPGTDPLVMNDGGTPVTAQFQVTIPAGTPAVRYTFTPTFSGGFVWRASAFPARFSTTLSGGPDNPTLTLFRGWRYEVQNGNLNHPWELIDTGAGTDVVLLSQSSLTAGSMEGDSSIGWTEGAASRFTFSPSLQAALDMYRCGVHTTSMRSPINIQTR